MSETPEMSSETVALVIEKLRESGVRKDNPVLTLAAALVIAQAEVERKERALARASEDALRLREALAFYADPASYDAIGLSGTVRGPAWRIIEDDGERARAALSDRPEP